VVFRTLFKTRPAVAAGRALMTQAAAQARNPVFYADWQAPDTREGRFELLTLHVLLLARRLKGHGPQAAETCQGLIDAYFENLDISLREFGTGDLSMSKKMNKLGQAFFGRAKALEDAFDALPNEIALEEAIARTVLPEGGSPEPFVRYVLAADQVLEQLPLDQVLAGETAWPPVRP
jgi:cytochrome b pre-mRNA-processing protein 3